MESNSYGMSLGQIVSLAFKRWWIILIAVVLGAALLFAYTYFFVAPMFTSSARIGIRVLQMNAYNESMTAQKVAKECSDILLADITLDSAAEQLNAAGNTRYTSASLRAMITTIIDEDTRFFDVNVTYTNPVEANRVCQTVINSFCDTLAERELIKEGEGIVLNYPTKPTSPSSPNIITNTLVGGILGLVISFFAMFIVGFLKDTVDCEDYLLNTYGEKFPILAVIPDANSRQSGYRRYTKKYGYGYGYGYGDESKTQAGE